MAFVIGGKSEAHRAPRRKSRSVVVWLAANGRRGLVFAHSQPGTTRLPAACLPASGSVSEQEQVLLNYSFRVNGGGNQIQQVWLCLLAEWLKPSF